MVDFCRFGHILRHMVCVTWPSCTGVQETNVIYANQLLVHNSQLFAAQKLTIELILLKSHLVYSQVATQI